MNRMCRSNPERIHRVVLLLPDEAEVLNRQAGNEFESCCPHLDIFHSSGRTGHGGFWKTCTVRGCQCSEETPPPEHVVRARRFEQEEAEYDARTIAMTWAFAGGAFVAVIWIVVEVFR